MSATVHHYYSLLSPWVYLGWPELTRLAEQLEFPVRDVLVQLPQVFKANGGVPGGQKSAAKQRYRDMELRRWSAYFGVEAMSHPRHHPFDDALASRLVLAATDDPERAPQLAYTFMQGLWRDDRDLADADTLRELVESEGLDADSLFAAAEHSAVQTRLDANTEEAIEQGVFGVPTYRIGDELFWGQDRLDFVERRLRESPE